MGAHMSQLSILIQNRETKQYLKGPREWTPNAADARLFDTALSAFYFAADSRIRDIDVVVLPVKEQPASRPSQSRVISYPQLVRISAHA